MDKTTQDWRDFNEVVDLEPERRGRSINLYSLHHLHKDDITEDLIVVLNAFDDNHIDEVVIQFYDIEHVRQVAAMFNDFLAKYDAPEGGES